MMTNSICDPVDTVKDKTTQILPDDMRASTKSPVCRNDDDALLGLNNSDDDDEHQQLRR